ncbi:MAG: glycosyltransferase family A protein, partial [Phormidesmis sp.]
MLVASPLISVVIATRNRRDRIVATIDSILSNDYPSFEIRVVDQSTDDACDRAMKKYEGDARIIYHHTSTVGMAKARNWAIARSKGN